MTSDVVSWYGVVGEVEIPTVEADRIGAEIGFPGGYYLQFFQEDQFDGVYENFGIGGGYRGFRPSEEAPIGVTLDASVGLVAGEASSISQEQTYIDSLISLGVAMDVPRWRPGAGVLVHWLTGTFESPGFSDGNISATNLGFFAGIDYVGASPEEDPILFSVQFMFGDYSGLSISGGILF